MRCSILSAALLACPLNACLPNVSPRLSANATSAPSFVLVNQPLPSPVFILPRGATVPPIATASPTVHETVLAAPAELPIAKNEPAAPTPNAPTPNATTPNATTPTESRSKTLANGLYNPMPGGFVGGYAGDTGLDIAGFHLPVHAIAAGTIIYSEAGHTRWATDDRAVLLRLDKPIAVMQSPTDGRRQGQRLITHVWYAHLSELRFDHPRGRRPRPHVQGGEPLGVSGIANRSPHLHLGLLLDGQTRQLWDSYLLADECRQVFGDWRVGMRLPR